MCTLFVWLVLDGQSGFFFPQPSKSVAIVLHVRVYDRSSELSSQVKFVFLHACTLVVLALWVFINIHHITPLSFSWSVYFFSLDLSISLACVQQLNRHMGRVMVIENDISLSHFLSFFSLQLTGSYKRFPPWDTKKLKTKTMEKQKMRALACVCGHTLKKH